MRYVGPKNESADLATQGDLTPSGIVVPFAGSTAPTGYLVCDGAAVSRTTYASLFAAIGTTYGTGNGSTTFNLPNLKGRVVVGVDAGQTEFDTLGETGGAKTHALTSSEMPSHNHGGSTLTTNTTGSHSHTLEGGSHAHNVTVTYAQASNTSTGGSGNRSSIPSTGSTSTFTSSTASPTYKMDSAGSHSHTIAGNTANTGGGGSHNNLQPYAALNYLIKT